MNYETMTREQLLQELAWMERLVGWSQEELNRLVSELEAVADDIHGECQYSYAPGIADALLVKLGYRKHWSERKK